MPVEAKIGLASCRNGQGGTSESRRTTGAIRAAGRYAATRRELLSPDWSREGVNPNTAPKDFDFRKRAGTSTVAR
jgi:hypothetical protein